MFSEEFLIIAYGVAVLGVILSCAAARFLFSYCWLSNQE